MTRSNWVSWCIAAQAILVCFFHQCIPACVSSNGSPAKLHSCTDHTFCPFFHCIFSRAFLNSADLSMQKYIGCKHMTFPFLWYVSSSVILNELPLTLNSHTGGIWMAFSLLYLRMPCHIAFPMRCIITLMTCHLHLKHGQDFLPWRH